MDQIVKQTGNCIQVINKDTSAIIEIIGIQYFSFQFFSGTVQLLDSSIDKDAYGINLSELYDKDLNALSTESLALAYISTFTDAPVIPGTPNLASVLTEGNITDGNPITLTLQDKLQGFPSANYINFNDGENDGIFINVLSGNGFVRLFEAVTWINNATLVRLQAPSIQLITEVFRLRDTSSNFEAQINMDKLTANRSISMPNQAGTIALESAIDETLNFGGGGSGDVASITVTNGIITARTLVP